MKKFLVAGIAAAALCGAPALAADMPVKGPVYKAAPAPMFNWTGFYIGGTAGYAWGHNHLTTDNPPGPDIISADFSDHHFVGGATAGYNWQVNNLVFGVETDFSNGPKGRAPVGTNGGGGIICGTGPCGFDAKSFGTVRGRVGIAADRLLVYGTGGYAYGSVHACICGPGNPTFDDGTKTAHGWVAGGGIEYAFANNWSAKLEYLHVDLGSPDVGISGGLTAFGTTAHFDDIRVGLNYKFGDPWGKGPVVAKY